jgi:HK97 family phage major capsid protein
LYFGAASTGRATHTHTITNFTTKGNRMDTELETKAGISGDALVTHGELMRAFEAFKAANDERLDEKRGDVLLEEKVARIDAALDATSKKLDAITLKGARPAFGRDTQAQKSAQEIEHKTAFEAYVRAGEATGLRALESKAMSIGSNPDGGYLVPAEVET